MSNPPPLQPLDYISPKTEPRKSWYPFSVVMSVYPAGAIFLIILTVITPYFRQQFHDYKMELPGSARAMLILSDWTINYRVWLLWVAIITSIPVLIGLLRNGRPMTPAAKRWIRVVTMVITLAFIVAAVVTLYLPLLELMTAVSGPNRNRW